ncbi:DNA circularization protein [Vibrio spartinae]|uniref:DNA circulation N-terminal domain-containing protein n=1 Tax=Vibrio spartinae TaxID=1918945 RepID=A0A1N6M617_9VIBR|nr:DNA circularization N-terminal domain-containing protein [Vibrio spartinae]SIO94786.1 hypothetical protein VSP9026_02516 [Vibrio spartinae]
MTFEYDSAQWQERQEASFRGVHFYVLSTKGKSGRRALAHEYPKRDGGWTEDNGGVLNNEMIKAELVGPDAETEFTRLLAALNIAGPGELIHPYWGIQQVQVGEVDYDFDNNERHVARLSFTVYAVGENLFSNTPDTKSIVEEQASKAHDVNVNVFESLATSLDEETQQTLLDSIDITLSDLDDTINNLPGLPEELGDWFDRLEHVKSSAGRLLAYPGELGRDITNLIVDLKDLVTELPRSLSVYDQLENRWKGLKAELTVKADIYPRANVYTFTHTAVVIAKVQAVATAPVAGEVNGFTDSTQASLTASSLSTSLQEIAEEAIDSGNRTGWRLYRSLRSAVTSDLAQRIQQLPSVKKVTPNRAIPVALLAYQQTGDTENRDVIVTRNSLSRPSFITPHQSIEVVISGGSNG